MYQSSSQPVRGSEFYQIGGFGCSINAHSRHPGQSSWKTSKNIAELLFTTGGSKSGLDVVFGIKPNGAAYLLIPRSDVGYSSLFPGRTYDASNFISLSPIHFPDAAALESRLDLLSQPAKKKKKNPDAPRDRSAANRSFTTYGKDSVVASDGKLRATFEYQRLLVRAARNELDPRALFHYTIAPLPWFRQIRVVSFAYNMWTSDHRGKLERGDDLKLLDVGWTEYTLGTNLSANTDSTVHFKVQENKLLTNKNPSEFLFGQTEVGSRELIQSRLQQALGPTGRATHNPLLLLVSNSVKALHTLQVLGADTESWYHGVEPILGLRLLTVGEDLGLFARRERYPGRRSERSRSPHRDVKPPQSSRARSPLRAPASPYPVYVVDVASLYKLVVNEPAADDSVRTMSSRLAIETSDEHPLSKLTSGWCAGNESRLLGLAWYKMATGNALDEQRNIYKKVLMETDAKPSTQVVESGGADSDSDFDPNDEPVARAAPPSSKDPYEALEDEDDDY